MGDSQLQRTYLAIAGLFASCGGDPATVPATGNQPVASLERAQELDPLPPQVGRLFPDLAFHDIEGRPGRLSDFAEHPLVIAVRDVGCPVSQRTARTLARIEDDFRPRGVGFLFLNLSPHNTLAEIRADNDEHGFDAPTVHDTEQRIGAALGALTTTEVFLFDGTRTLVYRGAIDDRIGRGITLEEARTPYLRNALQQTLTQEKVQVRATSAPGCLLGIEAAPADTEIEAVAQEGPTYHAEVARILRENCVECHRSGGVAPFALESYEQARGRRAMIRFVVRDGVMPPWFAAPESGPWRNDRRLSEEERTTLLTWIESGAPEGDPAETPEPYAYPEGWQIGEPDLVFRMREPFEVPAEGLVDFRYFEADMEVPEDIWIQRVEVRPEAAAVVHHVTVSFQVPSQGSFERELRRELLPFSPSVNEGWVFLFGYLPGKGPRVYPGGIARFLPKGSRLRFDMHYTPNGKAVVDQTSLGLVLAPEPPEWIAESRNFWNRDISIPPMASDVVFEREYPIQHDVWLHSLTPHMHLRGKSMVAELVHPDGTLEALIDLPAWDQNWQFDHVFREPRLAPAGSRVRVTAHYDNSPDNPANPDPTVRVVDGPQTADEMMSFLVEWIRPRLTE